MEEGSKGDLYSNHQKHTCTTWPGQNLLGSVSVPQAPQWHGMAFNNFSQWHKTGKEPVSSPRGWQARLWNLSPVTGPWVLRDRICSCGKLWSRSKVNTPCLCSELLRPPERQEGRHSPVWDSVTAASVTTFSHTLANRFLKAAIQCLGFQKNKFWALMYSMALIILCILKKQEENTAEEFSPHASNVIAMELNILQCKMSHVKWLLHQNVTWCITYITYALIRLEKLKWNSLLFLPTYEELIAGSWQRKYSQSGYLKWCWDWATNEAQVWRTSLPALPFPTLHPSHYLPLAQGNWGVIVRTLSLKYPKPRFI